MMAVISGPRILSPCGGRPGDKVTQRLIDVCVSLSVSKCVCHAVEQAQGTGSLCRRGRSGSFEGVQKAG